MSTRHAGSVGPALQIRPLIARRIWSGRRHRASAIPGRAKALSYPGRDIYNGISL